MLRTAFIVTLALWLDLIPDIWSMNSLGFPVRVDLSEDRTRSNERDSADG